jgi:DNA repair protein RecN (Recombination protein N)
MRVAKQMRGGGAFSTVELLADKERIEEIARMLGGVKITDTTRKHAAELLANV